MKHKRSYKVLWNVFLFVICGGAMIFGFVQQQRRIETRVELEACQQQVDSLKVEVKKLNQHVDITLRELQKERDMTLSVLHESKKQ